MLVVKFDKKRLAFRFLTIGVIAFLLYPSLYTSIHADETYGFVGIQGTGPWAPLYEAVRYPFTQGQLSYFLTEQGRIVPFSSGLYQMGFWLTTHVSVQLGIAIVAAHALLKGALLTLVFYSIRSWIRLLSRNSQLRNPERWATDFTLLVALLFAAGVRVDAGFLNGFVTYPVLTYLPIVFSFTLPSLLALFLSKRTRVGNAVAYGAAITLSIILTFGYELNFVAVGIVFLTLLVLNRESFPRARATASVGAFAFVISFVINRIMIARACAVNDCYVGTEVALNANTPATIWSNFIGSLPIKHATSRVFTERGISATSLQPGFDSPMWWLISIAVGLVAAQLVRQLSTEISDRFSLVLVQIGVLSVMLAGASILITSMSGAAQFRLLSDTIPFRGYMVTWTALAIALIAAILLLVNKSKDLRWRRIALISAATYFAFLTMYLRPYAKEVNALELHQFSQGSFAPVLNQLYLPTLTEQGARQRCTLLTDLGTSRQAEEIRLTIDKSFMYFYSIPFCANE